MQFAAFLVFVAFYIYHGQGLPSATLSSKVDERDPTETLATFFLSFVRPPSHTHQQHHSRRQALASAVSFASLAFPLMPAHAADDQCMKKCLKGCRGVLPPDDESGEKFCQGACADTCFGDFGDDIAGMPMSTGSSEPGDLSQMSIGEIIEENSLLKKLDRIGAALSGATREQYARDEKGNLRDNDVEGFTSDIWKSITE
mmetsp:Transcript_38972/g.60775  ORF Transcript_38972/g.60775 Transcript_38972/m.60775 type:complete len:200 (+) Transcript_38972:56-655(+)